MSSRIPDTHAEAWALLPWLANGRLSAVDREWVDAHVASCADCRAELAVQRRVAATLSREADGAASHEGEQRAFDTLWARIEAAETATTTAAPAGATPAPVTATARSSWAVRWLAAAVIVQAIGLGVLGVGATRERISGPRPPVDGFVTVTDAQPRLDAPALRIVFAPQASVATINTLLTHQGLSIVSGPGTQGNFTAVLSADAVASGASADSVAQVISKDPNVSFAQPVAR